MQVGGLTRAELRTALRAGGVLLNTHAETLLDHPVFDLRDPEEVRIVERGVADLGLVDGATLPEVYAGAHARGLSLCPPDAGPYLRLAWTSQADAPDTVLSAGRSPAGALKVASAQLSTDVEYPKGFYVRVVVGRLWLRGYRCDDEYLYEPGDRFAFRVG
ncbi:hypothetical protein KNO15_01710 [Leifsonia shinshuensis]|nr:hypothetical protein [Leifsonia shinshuensis]